MLYGGSDLDRAREVFAAAIYHRPRIRLTIRQRTHVLERWPQSSFCVQLSRRTALQDPTHAEVAAITTRTTPSSHSAARIRTVAHIHSEAG